MGGYGSDYNVTPSETTSRRSVASYNIDNKRKYEEVKKGIPPPGGKVLITKAKFPVVVAVDVTGSMSTYPKIIFEKLCILYGEVMYLLPDHLKSSFEISFAAIGDADSDSAPVQVTDFTKEKELDMNINALFPEGGGGGGIEESYELMAYYYARHCEMPEITGETRPLFIFISDEDYYPTVSKEHVKKLMKEDITSDIRSDQIFGELRDRFDVYNLRRSYDRYDSSIVPSWKNAIGETKVMTMRDPSRVVDIIIGIIASKVGKMTEFKERIEMRQTPEQVQIVYNDLAKLGIT